MTTAAVSRLNVTAATQAAGPVIHLDGETIRVVRPGPAVDVTRVKASHETQVIRALDAAASAGRLPGSPPASYGRALARALTIAPQTIVERLSGGIYTTYSDSADIATIPASLGALAALPGAQPRGASSGGRQGQVPQPVEGTNPEAAALGLSALLFDDPDHLRNWCADALARSLPRALHLGRREEIAATGVRRQVTANMTLLEFRDGTTAQWVPMVSDGISRLAVCATTLLGLKDGNPAASIQAVVDHAVPVSILTSSSSNHELARRLRRSHDAVVSVYERHVLDGLEDEHAVKLRQFLTLPVKMHLMAAVPDTASAGSMELAMEGIVSDLHSGVDGWKDADDAYKVSGRALKQMAREGDLDGALLDLCLGRTELESASLLRARQPLIEGPLDDSDVVCTADQLLLRRAVVILSSLLTRETYEPLKTALRDVSKRKRLELKHVVDLLAPVVCEPWGSPKPITGAWGYGGPVPSWILDVELSPAHPHDYLSLVETAMDESAPEHVVSSARLELALAGGTALIADGLLTTALVGGSGGGKVSLPFRGSIDAAVEALTHTEEGLTALAVAANNFKPTRPTAQAPLPAVDLSKADKVARDGVGMPVPTTEKALANLAKLAVSTVEPAAPTPSTPTADQTMRALAEHLPDDAQALLRSIELISNLHEQTGEPTGLGKEDLDAAYDSLTRAARLVGRLR